MAISRSFLLFILISLSVSFGFAEIRFTKIRSDDRPTIPFDEFKFTDTGRLELNVSDIILSSPYAEDIDLSKFGFFLSTRDAWISVLQQLEDGDIPCVMNSLLVKLVFDFKSFYRKSSFDTIYYQVNNADKYTLVFANCHSEVKVWMNVRSAMYNLDVRKNCRDYLPTGKTILPRVYFLLSLVYFTLVGIWIYVLYKNRLTIFRIHFFMLVLVILKAFNLVFEAEQMSYIQRTGSAHSHGWDVLFYTLSFLKGITLFTLIVLIGIGWSFLKPNLQGKEKVVLMIVIPLQVLANIAQVVLDVTGPFDKDSITWEQVFFLADVVCCCAVLFPIVWSIRDLSEAARKDSKAKELTLFRQYFIAVICYIYLTRIVVHALEIFTSYEYVWTRVVIGELATLACFVFTGYKFKPKAHNPYVLIDDKEEGAAAEQLKLGKQKWGMIEENGAEDETGTVEDSGLLA